MIYLDNASTTRIDPNVLDAMMPYLSYEYGNPGTIYGLGRRAKEAVENARAQVAKFIGAKPEQIIFTSGGTEANNMVFSSLLSFFEKSGRKHIITTNSEHISVLESARNLCIKYGFDLTELPVNHRGYIEINNLKSEIQEDTGLVSVMYMNNETGSENPVEEIGAICAERGVLFHSDCVQAAGCCNLDVKKIKCDFLSLSSHKIHGPKGVGALFVRDKSLISPMIRGGSAQEFGLRGGTENVAAIVGFGKACEMMDEQLQEIDLHNSVLKQLFYSTLEEALKTNGLHNILHLNGDSIIKHGKTINVRFDDVDGETLLLLLDAAGICVSSGSACHSQESKPSNVLLAMGISPEDARNSIRVSFSKMNSEAEVKHAAGAIASCVAALHS